MARLAPAVYDRKTGEHVMRLSIYYGGGTFATLHGNVLLTGWEGVQCFDTIIAEPWAFDLKTGRQKMVEHPITGRKVPWQFIRPEKHCGPFTASNHTLFFRNGGFGYCDIRTHDGVARFESNRPNCWTSFISAEGLALWPTSDSGCRCALALSCSVALAHDDQSRVFADFSSIGEITPAKHLALNLGAPGERRDTGGRLWFAFPRHKFSGGLVLPVEAEFYPGGKFDRRSSAWNEVAGTDRPWVFTSAANGLKKLTVALRKQSDGPGNYAVTLSLAAPRGDAPGNRVFDVKLQGVGVQKGLDIGKQAGGVRRALTLTFNGVRVAETLTIELVARSDKPRADAWPVLCGVDVVAE